jgi:hypothetical protein
MRKTYYLKDHPYPMQSAIYGKITQPIDREIYLTCIVDRLATIIEATNPLIIKEMLRYLEESDSGWGWVVNSTMSPKEMAASIIYSGMDIVYQKITGTIPDTITSDMMQEDEPDEFEPDREDVSYFSTYLSALILRTDD